MRGRDETPQRTRHFSPRHRRCVPLPVLAAEAWIAALVLARLARPTVLCSDSDSATQDKQRDRTPRAQSTGDQQRPDEGRAASIVRAEETLWPSCVLTVSLLPVALSLSVQGSVG